MRARDLGLTIPVVAGVAVYTDERSARVLQSFPGLQLDDARVERVLAAPDPRAAGIEAAVEEARALLAIDEAATPVRWFVLNAEANTEIDFTAADIMEELRVELADRGITLALARVKFEVREDLEKAGLIDSIGAEHVFATLPTAVEAYRRWAGTTA